MPIETRKIGTEIKDSSGGRSTFNLNSRKLEKAIPVQSKSLQIHFSKPLYHDLHVKLNIQYELDTEDIWTSRFYSGAVPDSITETISYMVRVVAPDFIGDKKRKCWLVWHSTKRGVDKHGNEVSPLPIVNGQDMQFQIKRNYNLDSEELAPTIGKSFIVFTQEFSPELVDKLINNSVDDPLKDRRYSITTSTYPAGFGVSLDEFKNLSIEELEARNKANYLYQSTDFLLSEQTGAERLRIQSQRTKKEKE